MNIAVVPKEHFNQYWKHVRDYLEPAVERSDGRWDMEHVAAACAAGHYHVMIASDGRDIKGVLTMSPVDYPGRRMMALHFLGGEDFDAWYPNMLKELTKYALACGCDGLEGAARDGFWKWFKADGWSKESAYYIKDLG